MRGISGAECASLVLMMFPFSPTNLGASKTGSPWLGCLTVSTGQEFEIGPVALRQRLDRGQSCAYYPQESREKRIETLSRSCRGAARQLCSILHRLAPSPSVINAPSRSVWRLRMLTFGECRAKAEEKLAQAEHAYGHRRSRLITGAEAWLFLASQLRRIERSFVPKRRSRRTTAWWIETATLTI